MLSFKLVISETTNVNMPCKKVRYDTLLHDILPFLDVTLYHHGSLPYRSIGQGVAVSFTREPFNAVRHPCGNFWPLH